MRLVIAAIGLTVTTLTIHAQPPPPPPPRPQQTPPVLQPTPLSIITGRVVDADSDNPLPHASLAVAGSELGQSVVLTDREGHFSIAAPAEHARLLVRKTGYARTEVAAAITGEATDIRLTRAATVSGRAVDQMGEPIVGAQVLAEALSSTGSDPKSQGASGTDDLGEYRVWGLAPGTYRIAIITIRADAVPQIAGTTTIFESPPVKTYYPASMNSRDAQPIDLSAGEDRSAIDFVVPSGQVGGEPFGIVGSRGPTADQEQTDAPPTGIIGGRVSGSDGQGIPGVAVRLFDAVRAMPLSAYTTDVDGQFLFLDLPAGRYRIAAAKPGYGPVDGGNLAVSGLAQLGVARPARLADAGAHEQVDFTLARLATISGQVLDELGEPVERARVELLTLGFESGRRRLVTANVAPRLTDDHGRYRFYGIRPGQFVVCATVGQALSANLPGYSLTYFPGSAVASEAQIVPVDWAQNLTGLDFMLTRTRTARISGREFDASGQPTMAGALKLKPSAHSSSIANVIVGALRQADGAFEFPNVPPGEYVIQAVRTNPSSSTEGESASLLVSVNGTDLTDIVLRMSAGSAIHGRFTFDTADLSKIPSPSSIELTARPDDSDLAPERVAIADIHPDWTFDLGGINGPRRLDLVRTSPQWALKEIRVNGVDVTDRPLSFGRGDQSLGDVEVVMTDRITELQGVVSDAQDHHPMRSHVLVFSTAHEHWYPASRFLRHAVPSAPDGFFSVSGMAPGTYYAAAAAQIPSEGADAWQDPEFLSSLVPQATIVVLVEGQRQDVRLRLSGP